MIASSNYHGGTIYNTNYSLIVMIWLLIGETIVIIMMIWMWQLLWTGFDYYSSKIVTILVLIIIIAVVVVVVVVFIIIIIIIIVPLEFFTSANVDGLSPEFEWQQVNSSLQDSSQYSSYSQKCCNLDGLHSSSNFQVLQSL